MFSLALKDESAYPPRCCIGGITLQAAKQHLPKSLVKEYSDKLLEMTTKVKVYCHNIKCNAFVAPHSIHNNQAYCQKCNSKTCVECKEASHFGPCTAEHLKVLADLAKGQGWQTCPNCRRIVERQDGCSHMT
jgi:hypothetical protein